MGVATCSIICLRILDHEMEVAFEFAPPVADAIRMACRRVLRTSKGCVANVASAPADAADSEFTPVDRENGMPETAEFGAEETVDATVQWLVDMRQQHDK